MTTALKNKIKDNETVDVFISEHPITPVIYVLPKIHKDPVNPPGRPIVFGMESVTAPLAQYLDKCLTTLLLNTKSYIKDTSDFLSKIQDIRLSADSILVSWDVSSLYTIIPHELGIEACRRLLIQSGIYIKHSILSFYWIY